MTLTYQRFTSALLLIYGSLFLSGIYYCLRVFWCAAARMSELELEQRTNIKFLVKLGKSGNQIREMLVEWLFSVPEDKGNIERKAFRWHWWHQEKHNGSSEGHSTKSFPKLFWRVDKALAPVHSFPRGVLWRRPRWYSAMRCEQFYRDEFANFIVRPRTTSP